MCVRLHFSHRDTRASRTQLIWQTNDAQKLKQWNRKKWICNSKWRTIARLHESGINESNMTFKLASAFNFGAQRVWLGHRVASLSTDEYKIASKRSALKGENINICQTVEGEKRAKSERNQCIESLLWVGVFAAAQFINKSKRNERKKIIFIIYVAFCVAWWWRGADNYMTKRRKEMISRFANAICVHNARRTRARQQRDQFEFKCVWCLYLHFSSLPIHATRHSLFRSIFMMPIMMLRREDDVDDALDKVWEGWSERRKTTKLHFVYIYDYYRIRKRRNYTSNLQWPLSVRIWIIINCRVRGYVPTTYESPFAASLFQYLLADSRLLLVALRSFCFCAWF